MNSDEVTALFASHAKAYCLLIEQHEPLSAEELLTKASYLFVQLYATAYGTPLPTDTSDDMPESELDHDAWKIIYRGLDNKLGDYTIYWEVFDPRVDSDAGAGDLANDFADVYRDLKEGLLLYDKGFIEDAKWQWYFNFRIHWGKHIVNSLRLLHLLMWSLSGGLDG